MLITVFSFLVVLGVLVLAHEFGHFFAARRLGIRVEEFGVGFPPRFLGFYYDVTSRRWRVCGRSLRAAPATIYSLNWIPIGGFVRIKGEQGDQPKDQDSFAQRSIAQRVLVISAGVVMNVLVASLLLSLGFALGTPQLVDDVPPPGARVWDAKIQIAETLPGLPAAQADLRAGDTIVRLDTLEPRTMQEVQDYVNSRAGRPITVEVERDGSRLTRTVTPAPLPVEGRAGLGVQLVRTGMVAYPLSRALVEGVRATWGIGVAIVQAFGSVAYNLVRFQPAGVDLSGPVGIAVVSGQIARMGWRYLLQFTALLSLNLAIVNFLPFPALDGGRVVFLLVERLRGRAVSARLEALVHNVGFVLLMMAVLLITYRDIAKFFAPPLTP